MPEKDVKMIMMKVGTDEGKVCFLPDKHEHVVNKLEHILNPFELHDDNLVLLLDNLIKQYE